jgi:hypothetical protein
LIERRGVEGAGGVGVVMIGDHQPSVGERRLQANMKQRVAAVAQRTGDRHVADLLASRSGRGQAGVDGLLG